MGQNYFELEIHEIDENFGHGLVIRPSCSFGMYNKVVTLSISSKPMMRYQGDCSAVSPCLISALTVRKLLAKGCQGILAYVLDTKKKVPVLEEIPVVKDVFDFFFRNYQSFLRIRK